MDTLENLLTVAWSLRYHLALVVLAGVGAFVAESLRQGAGQMKTKRCRCGCPAAMHVGAIGCPCGLPDEQPCRDALGARTSGQAEAPVFDAVCAELGRPVDLVAS